MNPFQDKHIAIVGASSGIGLALARILRAQGASLYTFSRTPLPADLSDVPWSQTDIQAPDIALTGLPDALHGFVYTPGTINLKPFNRIPVADFRKELEVNAVGAFQGLQQVFPALKAGRGSAVLFSTVAVQLGMPFHAGISAAKGAVEGLVRALAAEWAPAVRINAIAPSLTDTPLAGNLLSTEEKKQAAAGRHPMRRVGTPEDMAQAALFLLDPDRAGFITGQVLSVDGGMGHLKT
jgi:NAD(P)-dependent dehydrogenase (short-subunit alcohol dehydrogenase family)